MTLEPLPWKLLDPHEAAGLDLRNVPEVAGPLNSEGIECPWPWEFQLLDFRPSEVHTCSGCGEKGTPGMEHPDFTDLVLRKE